MKRERDLTKEKLWWIGVGVGWWRQVTGRRKVIDKFKEAKWEKK